MSTRMTAEEVAAHMARMRLYQGQPTLPVLDDEDIPDHGLENNLLKKCIAYCDEHGWPIFHDRSKKCNRPGFPDLFIFAADGRTILIELKSADGKLRKEQEGLRRQLNWLGHTVHVVRSYKKFLQIVNKRIAQGEG